MTTCIDKQHWRGGRNRGVNLPSPYFLSQFLPPPYFYFLLNSIFPTPNFSFSPSSLLFPLFLPSPNFFFGSFLPPPYSVPPPSLNWCLSHFTTVMHQIIVCVIVKATNILLVNCAVRGMNLIFCTGIAMTPPEILHLRDFETNLPFQTLKNSKKLLDHEKGMYTSSVDEDAWGGRKRLILKKKKAKQLFIRFKCRNFDQG